MLATQFALLLPLVALVPGASLGDRGGPRPRPLEKRLLEEIQLDRVGWVAVSDGAVTIAGQEVQFRRRGRSVEVQDAGRRLARIRGLPGSTRVTRRHGRRTYEYRLMVREGPGAILQVASCTGIRVGSKPEQSWVLDADLDGVFCEPGEDSLMLHDSRSPVPFDGSIWHVDQDWQLSEGRLVPFVDEEPEGRGALRLLNHCRQLTGLSTVEIDPGRARGAVLHANYIARNWALDFNHHTEDPSNEWYTEEGARSAQNSLFGYPPTESRVPYAHAIACNVDVVYHRRALLDPHLVEFGIGIQSRGVPPVNRGLRAVCIDASARIGAADEPRATPVPWPANGQLEVPTRFNGLEMPMPLPAEVSAQDRGYPVTLIYPFNRSIRSAELGLFLLERAGAKRVVAGWSFGPGSEIPSDGSTYAYAYKENFNICHFIALEPLREEQWYEAVCSWSEGLVEHRMSWTFRTGTGGASSLASAERPSAPRGRSSK